jgi:hypothetical protein
MSTTPLKRYVDGIYKKFGYRATWLPGTTVRLGDIGTLEQGVFVRISSLQDLGIHFDVRTGHDVVNLHHVSSSTVKISFQGTGSAPVQGVPALLGIDVQFGSEGAFIFDALGCVDQSIQDQVKLEDALRQALFQQTWKLPWMVVTHTVEAQSATILISNSSDSQLRLAANGNLAAAQQSLAHLDAKLLVTDQSGDVTKLLGGRGLTLMYRLSGLRPRFFSDQVDLATRGDTPGEAPSPLGLSEIRWQEDEVV